MSQEEYPIVLREEELNAQRDMQTFLTVQGRISRSLEGAERMLSDIKHPLKGAALFAHYCAALEIMPMTESGSLALGINPHTRRPYTMFQNNLVFPNTFGPMIKVIGQRLGNIYEHGILHIFHQAQEAAA